MFQIQSLATTGSPTPEHQLTSTSSLGPLLSFASKPRKKNGTLKRQHILKMLEQTWTHTPPTTGIHLPSAPVLTSTCLQILSHVQHRQLGKAHKAPPYQVQPA